MKNLTKFIFGFLVLSIIFASCNKSTDYEKLAEEQRIADSIENARINKLIADQAPKLKAFAEANFTAPILDSASGIWYDITALPTDTSYVYQFNSYGSLIMPTVAVKHKTNLLNGTQIGSSVEESADNASSTYLLSSRSIAWQMAFFPKKIKYNNIDRNIGGLTKKGLKKGSKIRFVTPSPWAYDTKSSEKVPANSPLYSEIFIETISN